MIRLAIVDDDHASVEELKRLVSDYLTAQERDFVIHTYYDGSELIMDYRKFDLIFLDIKMEKIGGLEIARMIHKMDENTIIVFVTRMAQYAIHGYEVNALDFLLKPVDAASTAHVLSKALHILDSRSGTTLLLKTAEGLTSLSTNEILYIEVYNHDLIYHTQRGEFRVRSRLAEAEEQLRGHHFCLSSRSCLVNLLHVSSVRGDCVMVGDTPLPLSRGRRREFIQQFTNYVGGN